MVGNKLNFTKGNIDSLPLPEDKYIMLHDEKTPGLVLRVYPSGVKSFFLYRWTNHKPEYVSIGRYPALTPEQARRKAATLNAEIGAGKNPAEEKRNIRAEMSLGELFERYLENHAKKHKRTWKYDESMFRGYFSHWRNRRISTITRREVQTLHSRMGTENGEHQANRAFAMLRTVFEKGREWGYAGENPCFKLKRFAEESRERYLQPKELPVFFQAVMAEPNEMERYFLLMLLYTGARKSNVLSMAWENISFELKIWNIPASQSKNKTAYTIPLVSPALEILTRRKDENHGSPWVFPSTSKNGHLVEPKKAWGRLLKQSGIENLRMHDLRRTLGSWMAITGSSLLTISYALGHKIASLSVTAVYARANVDPIRVDMERAVRTMLRKGGMIPEEDSIIEFKTDAV
jgi:integrase